MTLLWQGALGVRNTDVFSEGGDGVDPLVGFVGVLRLCSGYFGSVSLPSGRSRTRAVAGMGASGVVGSSGRKPWPSGTS